MFIAVKLYSVVSAVMKCSTCSQSKETNQLYFCVKVLLTVKVNPKIWENILAQTLKLNNYYKCYEHSKNCILIVLVYQSFIWSTVIFY